VIDYKLTSLFVSFSSQIKCSVYAYRKKFCAVM